MWTRSRAAKSATSVRAEGEVAKNSPGNLRGEPYTSSAAEAFSKTGTGVDAKIGAGVDQETHLCEPIRHIEAAGWIGAVARRH